MNSRRVVDPGGSSAARNAVLAAAITAVTGVVRYVTWYQAMSGDPQHRAGWVIEYE